MKHSLRILATFCAAFLVALNYANAQSQLLTGGNMEDEGSWQTSVLNSPEEALPVASWNDTDTVPTSGEGGALYIKGMSKNNTVQYAIYQQVTLYADSAYVFDAAVKDFSADLSQGWIEVFIGTTAPADGSDYNGDIAGTVKFAEFSSWNGDCNPKGVDGTFSSNACGGNVFIPDADGDYYFVLKLGTTSWTEDDMPFKIAIDELTLTATRTKPVPSFGANAVNGIAPLEVQFTNSTKLGQSYSWNFGDGSDASTEVSPSHTYATEGTYTVSLTATNEVGDSTIEKTEFIKVNPPVTLTGGGVLLGGNLEDESLWNTTFLGTPEGSEPTVTWNDTEHTPSAGTGGCLFVTGLSNNSTVQLAIYQQVTLSKDSVYTFDGAVKDFTENLSQGWYEVFIGTEPIDGLDYSKDDADKMLIADFSSWNEGCNPAGIDGTFQKNACTNISFTPDTSGIYYFVIKMGTTSWASDDMPFSLALDEISLVAERTKPITRFSAKNPLGFAPLTVKFVDQSDFATSWSWDFGDGSAVSTDENPEHTYENVGSYTVSLTTSNELGDSVIVKEAFVKVNEKPELPEGEMLYGGNMEDPNLWNISTLNATAVTDAVWNNQDDTLAYGEGGNLKLSSTVLNNQALYCIWQAVDLTAGMKYTFDAAFRDLSEDLDHFWSEVYIGTTPPVDGEDYGDGHTKIAFFNTWDCGTSPGLNGTYLGSSCGDETVGVFAPDTSGTYYFAIKTGAIDWENTTYAFEVLIDEVTLQESVNIPAPEADFFVDVTSGTAPLTVSFSDLSTNVEAWLWEFGDGDTSTVQNPTHTYTESGTFGVTLIAYNGDQTDTLYLEDIITVAPATSIDGISLDNMEIYPNPSKGIININLKGIEKENVSMFDITGKMVNADIIQKQDMLQIKYDKQGIYFIRVVNSNNVILKKIVIKK